MDSFDNPSTKLDMRAGSVLSIPAGQTAQSDFTFTEMRYLTGATYFREGGNFDDTLTLQMVHPLIGVIDQFATDIYMSVGTNGYQFYKATVPAGLIARVIYKNNGSQDARFAFNLILHKDR